MAETVGVDFKLKYDSSLIGGKEDATLNFSRASSDLAPTQGSGAQFRRRGTGLRDVSIDFDALWLKDATVLNGFSPTVTIDPSNTSAELQYMSEVTITLSRELVEFENSSNSGYLSRGASVLSATADLSVDIDASEFVATDNATKLLIDAWESTSGVVAAEIALPGGDTTFESDWIITDWDPTTPAEDASEATFSLESTGAITETLGPNVGAGLDAIVSEMFKEDPSAFTALCTTGTDGNWEASGPVLPSELEITIPVEGSEEGVNVSGTLDAAGPWTPGATTSTTT